MTALVLLVLTLPSTAAYSPRGGLEPDPWISGNVTFTGHQESWPALQYAPATGLNAEVNPHTGDPYFVDPTGISSAVLQNDTVGLTEWNQPSAWFWQPNLAPGSVTRLFSTTWHGLPAIEASLNTSSKSSQNVGIEYDIPYSALPSANPSKDYLSLGFRFDGPRCPYQNATPACTAQLLVTNGTYAGYWAAAFTPQYQATEVGTQSYPLPGGSSWVSTSLASMDYPYISAGWPGVNFWNSLNASKGIQVVIQFFLPEWPPAESYTYNVTVTAMELSQSPVVLGSLDWGKTVVSPSVSMGFVNLSALSPNIGIAEFAGPTYRLSVAQPMDLLSGASATPVALPSGSERVTYFAPFALASAPPLQYGTFQLGDIQAVPSYFYSSASLGSMNVLPNYTRPGQVILATPLTAPVPGNYSATVTYNATDWAAIIATPGGLLLSSGFLSFLGTWWPLLALAAGTTVVGVVALRR
ncbi:MAG TPA: hypothetical protein VGU43_04535 [Thermoplasmata archaeon]|nr:hypothetical protein [Thermoplasmata archaeon]